MQTAQFQHFSLVDRAKAALAELRALLFEPDFVIDEKPAPIEHGRHQMSTLSMKALTEEDIPAKADLLTVFTHIVRRELAAIERAVAAENKPAGDSKELERFMKQFVPFLDSFDRVLEAARAAEPTPELTNWLKAVEGLYFRVLKICERYELVPLKAVGKVVDLDRHEVVEYRFSPDHPGDTVISERQKGYLFRGRLLREAQVVVARSGRS
jgi:molecular chaperone GrpE